MRIFYPQYVVNSMAGNALRTFAVVLESSTMNSRFKIFLHVPVTGSADYRNVSRLWFTDKPFCRIHCGFHIFRGGVATVAIRTAQTVLEMNIALERNCFRAPGFCVTTHARVFFFRKCKSGKNQGNDDQQFLNHFTPKIVIAMMKITARMPA